MTLDDLQRPFRTDGQSGTDGRTTYDSNTALALRVSRGKKTLLYHTQLKFICLVVNDIEALGVIAVCLT